ncbi:pyridoxamine 5'-phosphate oxidase family protein [Leptolyngbya sp. CCNP1308]|uniref:pyridoxamine 5'-phosphate oxidase family protein n=1 Tax=Leptolyngbya sp. CCNP1308 TaxID=3110255 RepID=UPI002B2124FD|nr:pyridoxamine 5'-phosphate oxidase family protein [Leptolyngbya sp. CCNP1308]MEA5450903.1 pyridoxamine 5'-phosphate oxidase family protein [Leptolyngbya sp. CCNP1308]
MTIATAANDWVNTVDSQNPEVIEKAQHLLAGTIYCTLSTCSADGLPWASPLFFAYDPSWTLYWASAIACQHSQNLAANQGRGAIAIYSTQPEVGKGQGLYLTGTATELGPENVSRVISLLDQRSRPGPQRRAAAYLPPSPRRLYQFTPQMVWITGERQAVNDPDLAEVLVDTKIQLDLTTLVAATL